MTKVILINGKAGHGKDTFARILGEEIEKRGKTFLTLHFADLVKFYATQYQKWDGQKDQQGRALLQKIGNDTFRDYDLDYWARITAECAAVFGKYFNYDYILIPDTRYPNEIEQVKKYNSNTCVVKIVRRDENGNIYNNPNLTKEQKQNPSETSLDNYSEFDYIITNYDYDFEYLKEASNYILDLE